MTDTLTSATSRATFAIGDEQIARRVTDLLTESLEDGEAAVAAFERSDGRWDVTVHFAEPPDQERIRALVVLAASDEIAQTIVFDTVAAKDWVKASLEGLVPVAAGRFVVHGDGGPARVPHDLGHDVVVAEPRELPLDPERLPLGGAGDPLGRGSPAIVDEADDGGASHQREARRVERAPVGFGQ